MKDFEASAWFGLFAPSGTPAAVVARLGDALDAALKDESLRTRLVAQGDEPTFKGPQELNKYIESEINRWSKVIKAANIRIN